jgi:hypothetical protein
LSGVLVADSQAVTVGAGEFYHYRDSPVSRAIEIVHRAKNCRAARRDSDALPSLAVDVSPRSDRSESAVINSLIKSDDGRYRKVRFLGGNLGSAIPPGRAGPTRPDILGLAGGLPCTGGSPADTRSNPDRRQVRPVLGEISPRKCSASS